MQEMQPDFRQKCKIEAYLPIAEKIAKKYCRPYYHGDLDYDNLLSCAYFALLCSYMRYDGSIPIRVWLKFKIRFAILDYIKSEMRQKEKFLCLDEADPLSLSVNGDKIEQYEYNEIIQKLMDASKLSNVRRKRLYEYYWEGRTHLEIADLHGITFAGVSVSLKKSRKKMRRVAKNDLFNSKPGFTCSIRSLLFHQRGEGK